MGCMVVTLDMGREGDLEGLISNQAMIFLIWSLGRQDVCVFLDCTHCGEGPRNVLECEFWVLALAFPVTLSKSLPLSGLSFLC